MNVRFRWPLWVLAATSTATATLAACGGDFEPPPSSLSSRQSTGGSFLSTAHLVVPGRAASEFGDLDGDGFGDVLVSLSDSAKIYFGGPAGLSTGAVWTHDFPELTGFSYGFPPGIFEPVGDLTGDGVPDLIVEDVAYDPGYPSGRVLLFAGNAAGVSTSAVWTAVGSDCSQFGYDTKPIGDVNGDGFRDLFVVEPALVTYGGECAVPYTPPSGILFFGTAGRPQDGRGWEGDLPGVGSQFTVATGDLDGNAIDDLLVVRPQGGSTIAVYMLTYETSGFSEVWSTTGEPQYFSHSVWGPAAADVNGDGFEDALLSQGGTPSFSSAYFGSPSGPSDHPDWIVAFRNSGSGVARAGDVNGDGIDDVLVRNDKRIRLFTGATGGPARSFDWEAEFLSGPAPAGVGDVNGDGFGDIAIVVEQQVQFFLGSGVSSGRPRIESFRTTSPPQDEEALHTFEIRASADPSNPITHFIFDWTGGHDLLGAPHQKEAVPRSSVTEVGPDLFSYSHVYRTEGWRTNEYGFDPALYVCDARYSDAVSADSALRFDPATLGLCSFAYALDRFEPAIVRNVLPVVRNVNTAVSSTAQTIEIDFEVASGVEPSSVFFRWSTSPSVTSTHYVAAKNEPPLTGPYVRTVSDTQSLPPGFHYVHVTIDNQEAFESTKEIVQIAVPMPSPSPTPSSSPSPIPTASPTPTSPPTPTPGDSIPPPRWLSAAALASGAEISWEAVPGATSFNVYVTQSAPADEQGMNAFLGVASPLTLADLVPGVTYSVAVSAVEGTTEGSASEWVSVTPFLSAARGGQTPAQQPSWDIGGKLGSAFGRSLASGDFDGDGRPELMVGARDYSGGESREGRVELYRNEANSFQSAPFWKYEPDDSYDQVGSAIAAADVNGDGYDDVVAGAPGANRVLVFFGGPGGLSFISQVIAGPVPGYSGETVANAGDTNGDGYEDVLVGDPNPGTRRAYLYLGSSDGLGIQPAWSLDVGQYGSQNVRSVSSAGDVNGDGYADLLVGATKSAWLFSGGPLGAATNASWTVSTYSGSTLGVIVGSAGDTDGDGFDDVLVGMPESWNGEARLFRGSAIGLEPDPVWSELGDSSSRFGWSLGGVGDINGDGLADFAVGGPGGAEGGMAALYLGAAYPSGSVWTTTAGQPYDVYGLPVMGAGDVDGDGLDDLVVGASQFQQDGGQGRAFLFSSRASAGPRVDAGRPADAITGIPISLPATGFSDDSPLVLGYRCIRDWGDGSAETTDPCATESLSEITHEYENAGTYTVRLRVEDSIGYAGESLTQVVARGSSDELPELPSIQGATDPVSSCRCGVPAGRSSVSGGLIALFCLAWFARRRLAR